jgi:hypothetical protein
MIDVIDGTGGPDDWAHVDWDKETIWFEESDVTKPLTCSDIVFTRGKYEGSKLSEVSDSWYLKFIRDKNPEDYLIVSAFNKRLEELE